MGLVADYVIIYTYLSATLVEFYQRYENGESAAKHVERAADQEERKERKEAEEVEKGNDGGGAFVAAALATTVDSPTAPRTNHRAPASSRDQDDLLADFGGALPDLLSPEAMLFSPGRLGGVDGGAQPSGEMPVPRAVSARRAPMTHSNIDP